MTVVLGASAAAVAALMLGTWVMSLRLVFGLQGLLVLVVSLPITPGTWWTAVGPGVMTVLLVRVSGKDLLERTIGQRRPGYAAYVARTSGFVPRAPRSDRRQPPPSA